MSLYQVQCFAPGKLVANRYEIIQRVASGSMGTVYSCRHVELGDRLYALKVLYPEVVRDPAALARFHNEVRISYDLSHPNVVRAFEYLRDGELAALVMEYIDGGDLADRLEVQPKLTTSEIVAILCQIATGLQAVHNAGVVHRDLKPANILLTKDGQVKITDFGVARVGTGSNLTQHGGVIGALDYMSPEYLEHDTLDSRSDIYSLGMLAYAMLAGSLPFAGMPLMESLKVRFSGNFKAPSSLRTDCPAELDGIVLKALSRNPQDRYQNAGEFYNAIVSLQSGAKRMDNAIVVKADPLDSPKQLLSQRTFIKRRIAEHSASLAIAISVFIGLLIYLVPPSRAELGKVSSEIPKADFNEDFKETAKMGEIIVVDDSLAKVIAEVQQLQPTEIPSSAFIHTVNFPGETLAIIADWYSGDLGNWKAIAQANPNLNSAQIELGDKIIIPEALVVNTKPFPKTHIREVRLRVKSKLDSQT